MFPFRKVQLIHRDRAFTFVDYDVSIPQGTINTSLRVLSRLWLVVSIPQGTINTPPIRKRREKPFEFPFRKVQLIRYPVRCACLYISSFHSARYN